MPLVPLLPLFHRFNRAYFDETLTIASKPLLTVRWSDGRLRKTAGLYRRRSNLLGVFASEIVLSRPLLELLPQEAIESTLCHEMIHAWIDLVLKIPEGHGQNFHARMRKINSAQNKFQVTVRHRFPVPIKPAKWSAVCPICGQRSKYYRKVTGVACRRCCNQHYEGKWHPSCLLVFEPVSLVD